jgi:NADP-dependent 3-hydroxy acid dehydrogenase YdfG
LASGRKMPDLPQRLVVLAGATSALGIATARALVGSGARVVAVSREPEKLTRLAELGARTEVCDLTNFDAVMALADRLAVNEGVVDGVLPLVGGWRGGGGIPGQSDDDYLALEQSFTALRNTSRAFYPALLESPAGRLAIISSTAVARPLAGGANYAAIKAASEAWVRAVAHGFAKSARDAGEPLRAAAAILRVKSLDGIEESVSAKLAGLWDDAADAINDRTIEINA